MTGTRFGALDCECDELRRSASVGVPNSPPCIGTVSAFAPWRT